MELDIERNFATMCKEHTVHRMELTIGHNWRTVVKCTITGDKIGVEWMHICTFDLQSTSPHCVASICVPGAGHK